MARDFDGVNDKIAFGTDASIGGFTQKSMTTWIIMDTFGNNAIAIWCKDDLGGSAWGIQVQTDTFLRFGQGWTTPGTAYWRCTGFIFVVGTLYHLALTYDGGSTTNDPVFYVNGVSQTLTEDVAPAGTIVSDSADPLNMGLGSGNTRDLDGRQFCAAYLSGLLVIADVNRALWWGRPYGGIAVYHPLWTDKLGNEGTAVAAGTASGTTVVNVVCKCVRPGAAMMGMGIGY